MIIGLHLCDLFPHLHTHTLPHLIGGNVIIEGKTDAIYDRSYRICTRRQNRSD